MCSGDRFGSGQFPLMHSTRRVGTCTGLFSNCRKPVDAGEISQRVTTETFCLDSSASDDVPQTPHKKMNSLNSLRLDLWFLLSVWGNVVMWRNDVFFGGGWRRIRSISFYYQMHPDRQLEITQSTINLHAELLYLDEHSSSNGSSRLAKPVSRLIWVSPSTSGYVDVEGTFSTFPPGCYLSGFLTKTSGP